MIINNNRFLATFLLLAKAAEVFPTATATATADKKKSLLFSSVLNRSLQGTDTCDVETEHLKIYDELQDRYANNCEERIFADGPGLDYELKCSKTYGNNVLDTTTYQAVSDPDSVSFIPDMVTFENGDPDMLIGTWMTQLPFINPCLAFNTFMEHTDDDTGDVTCSDPSAAHGMILDDLQSMYRNTCVVGSDEWECSTSYGNGKSESVTYKTYTDSESFIRPDTILFSQSSPDDGAREVIEIFDSSSCDEFDQYLEFEWNFKFPPQVCNYEDVNNKVIAVINSVFHGDKYCNTYTDDYDVYVHRECYAPYGYIDYTAQIQRTDGFGTSGPAHPDNVLIGLTKDTADYISVPTAIYEEPCNAGDIVWNNIYKIFFEESTWYYNDDVKYTYDIDYSAYTYEDAIDGFEDNWYEEYTSWLDLAKSAPGDSVEDTDVVTAPVNDTAEEQQEDTTEDTEEPEDTTPMDNSDEVESLSSSSASFTRYTVSVVAAAVAVVSAIM